MAGKKVASVKTPVKPYNRTEHDGKKSGGTVKIKWVVSFISCTDNMRQTIRGLGLRRMHQVVERQDTPAWSAQAGEAGVEGTSLLYACEFAASCGVAQEEGSRWPRHGFKARQDRRRRQQGAEVAPRLFAPPRL